MVTAANTSLKQPTDGLDACFDPGVEVVDRPRRARFGVRMTGKRELQAEATEADAAMDRYAREGDPKDFARVIDLLQPRLLGYVRRQLHGDASAEDLVQTCFLKIHQHRGRFSPGAAVLPYAFAIARRLLIDKARTDRREHGREHEIFHRPPPRSFGPEDSLDHRRALARIESVLGELPPHYRDAFVLTAIDGLSLEEAAAVTDTTPTALKMRTHYAREALRARLGDDLEELLR
jgi:RNA polymerase sigma-70 factor (ECF subfamily)